MLDQSLQKANILIVDDKPEKVLALEAVVEDLQENIVRAYSGREALRCLLNQEFAVILLDVNMPGMDGFETASLIRQRQCSSDTPIIFVTAMQDEMDVLRGYSLGAVDYILTPIVPDVLRTKVAVFVELFRKSAQVKLQADNLRRRATQLQKLTAASLAINSAVSIERMLQTVTDTARELIGSHQAITLFILDAGASDHSPRTQSVTSFSDKYASWRDRHLQLDSIARSMVARSQVATRMSESQLREHPDWQIVKGLEIPPVQGGMIAVPLSGRAGDNLGVIYLADRFEGEFTSDDESILVQLAQMASIAIENTIYAQEREANRIKDEFLATLSHELRTPLNAMLGWTQLLATLELPSEAVHGLEVIDRNVRAQAKLIEDLLDISRITAGKFRLNVRPMCPGSMVEAAVDAIRPAAAAKRIRIECENSGDGMSITGDPDRLQQVVWNLLSNAVKFTPIEGLVQVSLAGNESGIHIAVKDSGQGIAAEFLPHVFDRFRQADSSSTRVHGGLGIGLSIARHIVELHGGTIRAQSSGSGQGATFTVDLPLAPAAARPDPDQPAPALPPSSDTDFPVGEAAFMADLAGYSVLLVDDEADARELIARILASNGADVTAVGSAREALDSLRVRPPQVLISDIAMPDEDGYALISAVRRLPSDRGGRIPALALTAYARSDDRLRALASGFQSHLPKPVEPRVLVNTVWALATEAIVPRRVDPAVDRAVDQMAPAR